MKRTAVLLTMAVAAGCAPFPVVDEPARYQESRINHLVLHFTAEHFERSLELLAGQGESRVSVHYLVPEPGDASYPHGNLRIYRLVPEERRAWHAGRSYWSGTTSLNDSSIGIEVVNRSTCVNDPEEDEATPEGQDCSWYDYPDAQVELVIRLASDILRRNKDIAPVDVIGHGDIAPTRRVDPGPLFPWRRLHEAGIGAWYDDDTVARYRRQLEQFPPDTGLVQRALGAYGYDIDATGENDLQTRFVVRAFQMHFRPSDYDGKLDAETAAIVFALLEKYRPARLRRVLQVVTD